MSESTTNRVTRLPGTKPTRLQLFVLPHAGGGASTYRFLRRELPPDVELCLVHLPGREARLLQPQFATWKELVADLLPATLATIEGPYALLGHSMGARLACELTRAIEAAGKPGPRRLLVSSLRAPHLPRRHDPGPGASDDELKQLMQHLGGTPPEVLAHAGLMAMVLPLFRADLALLETPSSAPTKGLSCGITVLGGRDDASVHEDELSAWRQWAPDGQLHLHLFSGGHFYLHEDPAAMAFLRAELQAIT